MVYGIFGASLVAGIALVFQGAPLNIIGWALIGAGALVAYRFDRNRAEERLAKRVARALHVHTSRRT